MPAAAFYTVNHNILLSNIARSTHPEATCRWVSNCIRGMQTISYNLKRRQVEGKDNPYWRSARLEVVTHAIQFYIADMDDITLWASGVKNFGTRAKSIYLFDGDVHVIMGKLAFDISTKVISDLVYARPGAANTRPKIKMAHSEFP